MARRLLSGALWFIAVSSLVTFVETLVGPTRQFGTIFGIAVASLVILDPFGRVWPEPALKQPQPRLIVLPD
jgi:hypothetical protein